MSDTSNDVTPHNSDDTGNPEEAEQITDSKNPTGGVAIMREPKTSLVAMFALGLLVGAPGMLFGYVNAADNVALVISVITILPGQSHVDIVFGIRIALNRSQSSHLR
ncbi:hypothetical protein [Roseiconus lacunae]|uniref:hypothetical protein n=1 Tax=Roseiconus lacunae TaxID=2605694 RepID=UPI001E5FA9F2|nr:hypothetical protein [Roseiconus lacunae]MCD0462097.1 hypothetical protein [Roseiconus lacunae]